jgi:chromosome segregation ATPase
VVDDLDAAAGDVLRRVTALDAHVDEAGERLAAVRGQVEQAGRQLEDDWRSLAAQFDSFLEAVEVVEGGLQQGGEQARRALGAAEAAVSGAAPAAAAIDEAREAVAALGEAVQSRGSEVAGIVDEAGAACESLARRAGVLEQRLADAMGEARDVVHDEVLPELEPLPEALRERGEALARAAAECQGDLDGAAEAWRHGLDALRMAVSRAFDDLGGHAGRMVRDTFAELDQVQRAALDELMGHAESLARVLASLAEGANRRVEEIGEGMGALDEEAAATATALEAMQDRLDEVRELLARFSFVSF